MKRGEASVSKYKVRVWLRYVRILLCCVVSYHVKGRDSENERGFKREKKSSNKGIVLLNIDDDDFQIGKY